jgi:hypothetical protein
MKYEIQPPSSELSNGYVTLILKYMTLFILGWLAVFTLLAFLFSGRYRNYAPYGHLPSSRTFFLEKPIFFIIVTLLDLLILGGWFSYDRKKKKLISVEIEDATTFITLGLLYPANGKTRPWCIERNRLRAIVSKVNGDFFGEQRILQIYDKWTLVCSVNIDLTAWCRHASINGMLTQLLDITAANKAMNRV